MKFCGVDLFSVCDIVEETGRDPVKSDKLGDCGKILILPLFISAEMNRAVFSKYV